MKKDKLNEFINKYTLGGNIIITSWVTNDKGELSTCFLSPDQSLIGNIVMQESPLEESELGIMDSTKLKQLLTVLEDDVELEVVKNEEDENIALELEDQTNSVSLMLANMSAVPKTPKLRKLPKFDLQIEFDEALSKKFIKAKNALADTETFSLVEDDGELKLVIGYTENTTSNKASLSITPKKKTKLDKVISFSAKYLKEILIANSEFKTAVLNISAEGLSKIEFEKDTIKSEYYLIEVPSIA